MAIKLQGWHIALILLLLFAFYAGYININLPSKPTASSEQQQITPEKVSVNKQLQIAVIDVWAGGASSGTVYIYDSDGKTQLEYGSLTSGKYTTSLTYESGRTLWLKIVNSDSKLWKQITVPYMNPADAESLTYNPVEIKFFTLCSLTDSLQDSFGNSYADGATWSTNSSKNPGADIVSATYSWYVSNDNTGFISSYDPINDIDWKAVLYVQVSGTGYENVILKGFDGAIEKGTAMWYWKVLDDTELTKYKVGNNYVYDGAGSLTYTVDLTGYTGSSATMQIYLYAYTDPDYFQTYGSFGPDAVQLAEHTIALEGV